MQRRSLAFERTTIPTASQPWAVLCLCALIACDKTDDLKGFFKAQPIDEKTSLIVETTPPLGATLQGSVDIDGQRVANKTPHTQKLLTPGKHQVRIEAAGYVSMELEAVVEDGKENRVQATLSPRVAPAAPGNKPAPVASKHGKKKKGGKEVEEETPAEEPDAEANVHSSKTLIVTASPQQVAYLDGASLGTATGLRVEVTKTAGELKMGEDDGLTFTYANKAGHVRIKPKDLSSRTLTVDGHVPKAPWIDVDTRARRIELTDSDGKKQTFLMKVTE